MGSFLDDIGGFLKKGLDDIGSAFHPAPTTQAKTVQAPAPFSLQKPNAATPQRPNQPTAVAPPNPTALPTLHPSLPKAAGGPSPIQEFGDWANNNIVKPTVSFGQRAVNTAQAGGAAGVGLLGAASDALMGEDVRPGLEQANKNAMDALKGNNILGGHPVDGGQGAFITPEASQHLNNPSVYAGEVLKTAGDVVPWLVGGPGAKLADGVTAPLAKIGVGALGTGATVGGTAATGNAISQLGSVIEGEQQGFDPNQANKAGIAGAIGGTILGGAPEVAGVIKGKLHGTNGIVDEPPQFNMPGDEVPAQSGAEIPKTDTSAPVTDAKPTDKAFNADQYVNELSDAQDAARDNFKPIGARLKDLAAAAKTNFVDTFSPIEDKMNTAIKNGANIDPEHNIRFAIDKALRSDTRAAQFAKDNGLTDIIQSAPKLKHFEQYLIAKHAQELEANGVKTGRDAGKDAQLVESLKDQYEPYAKKVTEYSDKLMQRSVDDGLITPETAKLLKEKYPNYVPFQRIFNDEELPQFKGNGSGKASISAQTVVQKIVGSDREVESPLHSLLTKTKDVISQGDRSNAGRILASYKDLEGNPFGLEPLRTADRVEIRNAAKEFLKTTKPQSLYLRKALTQDKHVADVLQRELDQLNKDGLQAYLARQDGPKAKAAKTTITVKQRAAYTRDQSPQTLNDLKQSYAIKGMLAKEYGRGKVAIQQMAADLHNGGWNQLMALNPAITRETAKSIAEQILKEPKEYAGSIKVTSKTTKGDSASRFIEDMISKEPDALAAIQKKIALREPRAAAVVARIADVQGELEGLSKLRYEEHTKIGANADKKANQQPTISFMNRGIKETYLASQDVADAAKNLTPEQLGLIGKIFSYPTRALRLGATGVNVGFTLANVTKDAMTAFINAKHPGSVANPKVFLQALKAATMHDSPEYAELIREGAGGTSFDIARDAPKLTVSRVRSEKNFATKALYTVTSGRELLRAVENTIGRGEELGRAAQYFGEKHAQIKQGASESDARLVAADAARSNTTNFARAGKYGRVLNAVLPYLNAGVQGSRQLIRSFRDRPDQTIAKIVIAGFIPVATTTAWNLSDPKRKKAYDNISDYEKEGNIIIVPPDPKQDASGRWNVIKIPVSQEVANLNNIVRNGVEALAGDKNFNFAAMAGNLFGTATSIQAQTPRDLINQATPQAIKPAVEVATNTNLFTGNQIVPDSVKNLPEDQQATKNTSGTARVLGKATGTSPLVIDNELKTMFGGAGQNVVNLADKGLAQTGAITPDQVRGSDFGTSITNRFTSAQGQTEGSLYFSTIQQSAQDNHLVGKDEAALQTILTGSVDANGKSMPSDDKVAMEKYTILYTHPNVAAVMADAAKKTAVRDGTDLDPLYKLTPAQQSAYYRIQSTPYKSADYTKLTQDNAAWLPKFQQDRSAYFTANPIPTGGTPTNRVQAPSETPQLTSLLNQYDGLDSTQKSDFIAANPSISKYFDDLATYANNRREATGYDPLRLAPKASDDVSKFMDQYFAADSGTRKTLRANNPDLYAGMQNYEDNYSRYSLDKQAATDQIIGQGEDPNAAPNQTYLKNAFSLGQYGIAKGVDANGNAAYDFFPSTNNANGSSSTALPTVKITSGGYGFKGVQGYSGSSFSSGSSKPKKLKVSVSHAKVRVTGGGGSKTGRTIAKAKASASGSLKVKHIKLASKL
jgi:hypothetical protein